MRLDLHEVKHEVDDPSVSPHGLKYKGVEGLSDSEVSDDGPGA